MRFGWVWEIGRVLGTITPLFHFIHGLVFLILGLVLLFTHPRAQRLELARRLPLLAVFAFCEATAAWERALAPALSMGSLLPPLLRTALLGTGYGALLAFGLLARLPPGRRARFRTGLAPALVIAWLTVLLILTLEGMPADEIAFAGEIAIRCGLALPGGILALLSMRHQSYRGIELQVQNAIRGPRRVAGVGLGLFGLLAGLLLPSLLITESIGLIPLPPRLVQVTTSTLISLCGVSITYGLMRTLSLIQREVERWIEGVEQSLALAAERERIGRELHDGIIQSIYAAGLMLEGVRQTIEEDPPAARVQLSRAMVSLNQTIQDIRRYIFDLRGGVPEADLVSGLEELLRDFRVNTLLETKLIVEGEDARPLGVERRRHIFQIAREALSNVARHAQARRVEVRLLYGPDTLQLQIADDGVGLTAIPTTSGQGLRNIRERARLLEGTLDIDSAPGQGVTLTLTVPYLKGEV